MPIHPPQILSKHSGELVKVLLAIPTLSRRIRRQIVDALQEFWIPVLQVPSVEEITSGRACISALRPVQVEELIGRDAVPPDPDPLALGPKLPAFASLTPAARSAQSSAG